MFFDFVIYQNKSVQLSVFQKVWEIILLLWKKATQSYESLWKKGLAINLPTCQMQLCTDSWNQTLVIPLASSSKDFDQQSNSEIEYTLTPIVR